jgi:intraflagellar transport protein 56
MIRGTSTTAGRKGKSRLPVMEEFINNADFTGGQVLAAFQMMGEERGDDDKAEGTGGDFREWLAYCSYHLGDFDKAYRTYEDVRTRAKTPVAAASATLACAICAYKLGNYLDAQNLAATCPESPAKTRLLFHVANKMRDESTVFSLHRKLSEKDLLDQLSFAALQAG